MVLSKLDAEFTTPAIPADAPLVSQFLRHWQIGPNKKNEKALQLQLCLQLSLQLDRHVTGLLTMGPLETQLEYFFHTSCNYF